MGIFDRIFRKKTKTAASSGGSLGDEDFQWHDPGPENPFGVRYLDCRPLTQTVTAWTEDPEIATRYTELRHCDGKNLISAAIPDAVRCPASLIFPHNGAALEGIVFKSPEMEVKWDVYIYDSVFYFARSWTGELHFRAFAEIGESEIRITSVECRAPDENVAVAHVYFILGSHVLKRVLPHRLPPDLPFRPRVMAILSFQLFGRYAWYATQEDITVLPISGPGA